MFEGSGDVLRSIGAFRHPHRESDGYDETLVREKTGNRSLVVFDRGDTLTVEAGEAGIRFLLVSGKPIRPVAWHGPIVINTQAELSSAAAVR